MDSLTLSYNMWYKLGQVICNLHTIFANTDARSFSSYNPRTNNWISATVRCRFHILLIYISSSVIITLRFSYTYIFLPIPDINNRLHYDLHERRPVFTKQSRPDGTRQITRKHIRRIRKQLVQCGKDRLIGHHQFPYRLQPFHFR